MAITSKMKSVFAKNTGMLQDLFLPSPEYTDGGLKCGSCLFLTIGDGHCTYFNEPVRIPTFTGLNRCCVSCVRYYEQHTKGSCGTKT